MYVRDTAFDVTAQATRRALRVLVRKDGHMILAPELFFGDMTALDSAGKPQPWRVRFGGGADAEIASVTEWGWAGDSVWVVDRGYSQVALLGADGKIARSVRFPSWIRPRWRDRRQYPLFANMTWHAMYGDGTLLAEPSQVRRLFDTPAYDREQKLLVRVDRDGRILRTVARAPAMQGVLQLRSGAERKNFNIPNYPRSFWKTSTDGERVALVTPIPNDSGAFRVTMVSGQGDTVYSRRYGIDAKRVPAKVSDEFLANVRQFGRYSAQQVRDTIAKLIPVFDSPVTSMHVGVDHSVWVLLRRPTLDPRQAEWMVIDRTGAVLGTTTLPRSLKVTAVSLDRIWIVENDRVKQTTAIVRFRRADARVARPVRSASGSGSSSPARPRE